MIHKIHHHIKTTTFKGYNFFKKLRKKRNNINILLTTIAVVMIRRGTWGLLDTYLFPNNEVLSFILSILLGLVILFIDNEMLDELDVPHR